MRLWRSWLLAAGLLFVLGSIAGCGSSTSPSEPRGGDTTAPIVAGVQPTAGAIQVATDASITAIFNEAMDPASAAGNVILSSGGSLTLTWIDNRTLSIAHATAWAQGVQVHVTLGTGFADAAGNHLAADYAFSFYTQTTAVLLVATDPLDAATNVNRSANVRLQFSVAMDASSIAAGVTIHDVPNSTQYPFTVDNSGADNWLTLDITNDLPAGTTIVVSVAGSVHAAGLPGNTLGTATSFSFTTGVVVDTTPPTIVSFEPASGAVVSADVGMLRITFSEPINPDSFHPTSWNAEMAFIFFSTGIQPIWSEDNSVMTVPLPTPLPAGLPMAITVAGYQDASGNAQPASSAWSVTVAGAADYYPVTDGLQLSFVGEYQRGELGNPQPTESGTRTDFRKLEQQVDGTFHLARYDDSAFTPPSHEWDMYRRTASALDWLGFTSSQSGQPPQENAFDSPVTMLHLPLAVGTWMDSTTVTVPSEGTYAAVLVGRVLGRENLTVAHSGNETGLYFKDAWKVTRTLTVKLNSTWALTQTDTTWYSPTLGPVRIDSREEKAAQNSDPAQWNWSQLERDLGFGTTAK